MWRIYLLLLHLKIGQNNRPINLINEGIFLL